MATAWMMRSRSRIAKGTPIRKPASPAAAATSTHRATVPRRVSADLRHATPAAAGTATQTMAALYLAAAARPAARPAAANRTVRPVCAASRARRMESVVKNVMVTSTVAKCESRTCR